MNVKELKELLDCFDDDMPVFFSYNYGDYPKTIVAKEVDGASEERVEYSDYHRMMKIASDDTEDTQVAIVLS